MKRVSKTAFVFFFLALEPGIFAQTSQNLVPAKTATLPPTIQGASIWVRTEMSDPLSGDKFSGFSLEGKYIEAPRNAEVGTKPTMFADCKSGSFHFKHSHGKFEIGGISIKGSVVDSQVGLDSVGDVGSGVPIEYRLDDGKLKSDSWDHSRDYSSVIFGAGQEGFMVFSNLLFGHSLPHKENTNPQVRKVVIGVPEYLGGEIVMQFDLPDSTEVADTCGVIWHKK